MFRPAVKSGAVPMMASVVLIALGMLLAGAFRGSDQERVRIENRARAEKLAVEVAQKEQLSGFILVGKVLAGVLALVLVGGLGFIGLRYLDRRASEIRPGADGQFPLVRVRVAGATILADPNRQLAAAMIYASPGQADQVVIQPVIVGDLSTQERQAARASAVQLASAVHRHPPVLVGGQGNSGAAGGHADEITDLDPVIEWPGRVPLTGLLNGIGSSLSRLVLGVTVGADGQRSVVTGDMSKMVHVAVGGSAGWGKSVFLQSLVYQLATCPERPDLALVDLDGTTLSPFASSDRLLYPLAESEQDALAVFAALADELERRKALYAGVPGVVDLASYNVRGNEPLAPCVLVTDEATALLGDKSVEAALRTLALRGRKFGLWVVLAGQDWKASSLDSAIKNQLSTTVQFRAKSASQSRVLLGDKGAENLPVPGRCLASLPGQVIQEVQAAHVSYDTIAATLGGQGGARLALPDVITSVAHGLTDEQIDDARTLWADGKSYSAIADAVFQGGRNTKRVETVRQFIESDR